MYTLYWYLMCVCVYLSCLCFGGSSNNNNYHRDCMNIVIYTFIISYFTKLFSSKSLLQTTILRKGHRPKHCVFCC